MARLPNYWIETDARSAALNYRLFLSLEAMRGEREGARNQAYAEPYRGFKSLPLRQFFHFHIQRLTPRHWFPIKSLFDNSQVRFFLKKCLFVRDLSESLIQLF